MQSVNVKIKIQETDCHESHPFEIRAPFYTYFRLNLINVKQFKY